ncbi:YggS family pyridoxal phosphate-dependent enzyme [Microlunatus flavus]|uniref:YggS family pyridoxal phosphate-dependent enzyme n=1 Tax=Microlunatus flavus TaxID=1036181 RepID=UPI000B89166B|nr:YggS family pyridoxal phosphate-dependent enzyme [Microlunatus flavus]
MDVAANLARVRRQVDEACAAAGRDPGEVRLLPVSKTHPPELLQAAYDAGVRLLGENRVQEAAEKADHFADRPDLRWAMIGHLQTNKARQVAAFADEFHALDSLKIARALHKGLHDLDRSLDVFVQVNSSGEAQKSGLAPGEVADVVAGLAELPTLRVRGLMTVAVQQGVDGAGEREVAACFERMVELRESLPEHLCGRELSMGMSGDLALAIAHGATTVRVGQAVFGARETR